MSGPGRRLAAGILAAASRLLPPHLARWGEAMKHELAEVGDSREALRFAAGCLRAVLGLAIAARLRSIGAVAHRIQFPSAPSAWSLATMNVISANPRLLGFVCGAAAVATGLLYMLAAGAPSRHLLMNLAALILGASLWLALGRTAGSRLAGAGAMVLALAVALLLTAFFGIAVDGASRWVRAGPLTLQVSFVVLPVMLILYARRPDVVGTAGMTVAALALAVQPDRAMAGVLAAGLIGPALAAPGRLPRVAAAVSVLAFGWTLITPDTVPAAPFVDRVLYSAFAVHPLAGLAVLIGAAALAVPGLAAASRSARERPALLAFGGCWLGAVVAAALGDYPAPLVGYGGSAVLGYWLSVALLPGGARRAGASRAPAERRPAGPASDPSASELRVPRPA